MAAGGNADVSGKVCPLCRFGAPSVPAILSHLRTVHSHDANFVVSCGIDGCSTTSRTFSALYSHIYRRHPHIVKKRTTKVGDCTPTTDTPYYCGDTLGDTDDMGEYGDSDTNSDIQYLMGTDVDMIRRSSALFLLKLKEHRRITQVAIDDIVEGTKGLFLECMERVQAGVRATIANNDVDPSSIKGLDSVFKTVPNPFDGIETCHLQEEYFYKHLNLVDPREIRIGEPQYMPQFSGSKRNLVQRWDTYQYVPLLSSLRQLLADRSVIEQIEELPKRIRTDGLIEDFCDGKRFKSHPLFSLDTLALQIIAFYDEVEICNPLGSHVKQHKLGIVFYTLGNISPLYRSQLKAINLAIVATVPVIEVYGLQKILQPFVRDLNILATTGISVTIDGCNRVFKGGLLTCLADNLASNQLGGFKQSFSFAFRWCRTCLVSSNSLCSSFVSVDFERRTKTSHEHHLQSIQGPLASHFSKVHGINCRSALLDVIDFDMFDGGLAHDAMHDIFEGIAPLEVKLLLCHCISKRWFTLNEYNDRLLNFNFGYAEKDKPIPILPQALQPDKSLKSSASQMALLLRVLPFIVGEKIPEIDLNWKCFLLLRKIVEIVLSPIVSTSLCSSLQLLIKEHHKLFIYLYGEDAYIPKSHLLIHYPEQMKLLGPMVRTNTFRHEAKLNFFKRASCLSNFKNVALSMANRHQRWMCYELASGSLLSSPLECGPAESGTGLSLLKHETENIKHNLVGILPQLSSECQIFRPKWVKKNGVVYQSNNAYLITGSDGLDPIFSRLDGLMVLGGDLVVFVTSVCSVSYFDSHYHAYVIVVTHQKALITKLVDHNVYHSHTLSDGATYITLRYTSF